MPTWAIVILSILAVLIGLFIALIIVGRKMQKKQAASQADIEAASQVISMLVIDKKTGEPKKLKDGRIKTKGHIAGIKWYKTTIEKK